MCTENKTELAAETAEAQAEAQTVLEEETVDEAVEEAAEPAIIIFPDEEEDEPVVIRFPDDEEEPEEERYVPKAVEYRRTKGIIEVEKKPKSAEQLEWEKRELKREHSRSFVAEMLERPLFNLAAWLALGFVTASGVLADLYILLGDVMYGKGQYGLIQDDDAIIVIVLGALIQMVMAILTFVGFRITVVSARNNGANMSTAGLSMARIAAVFMLVLVSAAALTIETLRIAIVFAVSAAFLVSYIISISSVRKSIIYGQVGRLSIICAVMSFVFAALNVYSFMEFLNDFISDSEPSVLGFFTYTLSAVSHLLFGIFIIFYNVKRLKFKKKLEEL